MQGQQGYEQQALFGTSYVQHQQTQSRLVNPTPYHIEQTQRRSRTSTNGAPPTPNNSYSGTIDPGLLANSAYHSRIIKQEALDNMATELDYTDHNNIISPSSNSPLDDIDEFGTASVPIPTSNVEVDSQFGESPGTQASVYSPGPDTAEFGFDLSSSAPPTTTAALPMGVVKKNQFGFCTPDNSFPGANNAIPFSLPAYSASVPAYRVQADWGDHSAYSGSLQFTPGGDMSLVTEMIQVEAEDNVSRQQALQTEKKRRRRESHNAVERRRRDHINERIHELSTLLPETYADNSNKPNKGVILRKSVDYIRDLKQSLRDQSSRNQKLEELVKRLQIKASGDRNGNSGNIGFDLSDGGSSLP
ncbi:1662_t:CDS:2 [Paraglomus brasilianum]|uniref:1662_t:CDS:1 n=1 Tax=Paraglomus brasilianum TaxID=144538 RepID=A0A9N8WIJ5_9GLOM|nr:1662_t:CDS:2 [Paraglomus brasilianum]